MRWYKWLLSCMTLEVASQGVIARPVPIDTFGFEHSANRRMTPQKLLSSSSASSQYPQHAGHDSRPAVDIVFQYLDSKHKMKRSCVRFPLRERFLPGTDPGYVCVCCVVRAFDNEQASFLGCRKTRTPHGSSHFTAVPSRRVSGTLSVMPILLCRLKSSA